MPALSAGSAFVDRLLRSSLEALPAVMGRADEAGGFGGERGVEFVRRIRLQTGAVVIFGAVSVAAPGHSLGDPFCVRLRLQFAESASVRFIETVGALEDPDDFLSALYRRTALPDSLLPQHRWLDFLDPLCDPLEVQRDGFGARFRGHRGDSDWLSVLTEGGFWRLGLSVDAIGFHSLRFGEMRSGEVERREIVQRLQLLLLLFDGHRVHRDLFQRRLLSAGVSEADIFEEALKMPRSTASPARHQYIRIGAVSAKPIRRPLGVFFEFLSSFRFVVPIRIDVNTLPLPRAANGALHFGRHSKRRQ